MLPWQPTFGTVTDPPHSFVTVVFQNRLEYRYVNVCVNNANDASTSCQNFVNLSPVTPGDDRNHL